MRRVYLAQYSSEPILNEVGTAPRHLAEPLLVAASELKARRLRPAARSAEETPSAT